MTRHIYRCPLRWSDMDTFGHVNNAVYFRYLEEARIDLTFRLAPGEGDGSFSGGSVVARHEIDYLRPLLHSYEPVTVETWVEKMGAASITYAYEIKDAERVYARATSVVVPYNMAEQRPRRLTPAERKFLDAYRDDGADRDDGDNPDSDNPDGDPDGGRPGEAVAA
ncbi:MAG: acyl-CoA thioesterase [Streptomycetaceae bacterium]|nr:acyl-CoA thioesterase [Streptomycetaceae bacterium]